MTIEYTPDGTPYLSPASYLSETPPYTQELAQRLDAGGGGGAASIMPVGAILPYMGETAPDYWLVCDGSQYDPDDLPELYAVSGEMGFHTDWRFRVPDMRGRTPFGVIGLTDMPYGVGEGETLHDWSIGERYGSSQPPRHTHTHKASWSSHYGGDGAVADSSGYIRGTDWKGAWHADGFGTSMSADMQNPYGIPPNFVPDGMARNVPPGTGVNFIVYAGRPTVGIAPIGDPISPRTSRVMIEDRLAEDGISEEERAMLKEQLTELKEQDA